MLDKVLNEVNLVLKAAADSDELYANLAVICKKATDALIKEGFSREEAINILEATAGRGK